MPSAGWHHAVNVHEALERPKTIADLTLICVHFANCNASSHKPATEASRSAKPSTHRPNGGVKNGGIMGQTVDHASAEAQSLSLCFGAMTLESISIAQGRDCGRRKALPRPAHAAEFRPFLSCPSSPFGALTCFSVHASRRVNPKTKHIARNVSDNRRRNRIQTLFLLASRNRRLVQLAPSSILVWT